MRLFIAIRLSDEVRRVLLRTQTKIQEEGIRGKLTPEENMHLTLAFIGEYHDPERVCEVMETVPFERFTTGLDGYGHFNDLWWVGMKKCDAMDNLVRRLRLALSSADIPFDSKKFVPHITLIRKANPPKLPALTIPPVSMTVSRVSLMRSERGRNNMIYTEIGGIDATDAER